MDTMVMSMRASRDMFITSKSEEQFLYIDIGTAEAEITFILLILKNLVGVAITLSLSQSQQQADRISRAHKEFKGKS